MTLPFLPLLATLVYTIGASPINTTNETTVDLAVAQAVADAPKCVPQGPESCQAILTSRRGGGWIEIYDHSCKSIGIDLYPQAGIRMTAAHLPYDVVITRVSKGFKDLQNPDMVFEFLYAGASYGSGKSTLVVGKTEYYPATLYLRVGFLCHP